MTESTAFEPVRCRGCGRIIGHARARHDGIFCATLLCSTDIPATQHEGRDAVFEELVRVLGHDVAPTAAILEITRQRAYQILRERSLVSYTATV